MLRHDLETLLDERSALLFGLARRLCRTNADAEDLVQETVTRFLAAFGGAARLPSESACSSWLVNTLRNCFYDTVRRQRAHQRRLEDPALLLAESEDPTRSPEPMPCDRISTEALHSAIQALSPRLRTTVAMHVRGRKYQEIARELGLPVGTVARRLNLGRAKLRSLLQPALERAAQ